MNAKVSFDKFSKKLHLISVSLGDVRIKLESRIITLTLWSEEVSDFIPRLSMVSFKANVVA